MVAREEVERSINSWARTRFGRLLKAASQRSEGRHLEGLCHFNRGPDSIEGPACCEGRERSRALFGVNTPEAEPVDQLFRE
jgi:hypothetical protein